MFSANVSTQLPPHQRAGPGHIWYEVNPQQGGVKNILRAGLVPPVISEMIDGNGGDPFANEI